MHNNLLLGEQFLTEQEKDKIDSKNLFNRSVLDAILDDDSETFTQLISQNINVSEKSVNFEFSITDYKIPEILTSTPTISEVCVFFNAEKCFSALLLLIPDGIKSQELKIKDSINRSIVHFASCGGSLQILRQLYQAEFDLNEADLYQLTPSHYAAMFDKVDVMKYFISKGIKVLENMNFRSMTPLHTACESGSINVIKFFCEQESTKNQLKFIDVHQSFLSRNHTLLFYACKGGNPEVVDYLLSNEMFSKNQLNLIDNDGISPLIAAVICGSVSCVASLLKTGRCKFIHPGRLHVPVIDAAFVGNNDILKYLLQNGADVNDTTKKGYTALDVAVASSNFEGIQILIDFGAMKGFNDVKMSNLFIKVQLVGNMKMIDFFDKNFDIPYGKFGYKFLQIAIEEESEQLVDFLIDRNCFINNVDNYMQTERKHRQFLLNISDRLKKACEKHGGNNQSLTKDDEDQSLTKDGDDQSLTKDD